MIIFVKKDIAFTITTRTIAEKLGSKYTMLIKDLDLVWLWPTTRGWDKVLRAAGHDPSKIDYAVPQQWLDVQYDEWGSGDWHCHAFWTYEGEGFMGKPLYQKHVVETVTKSLIEHLRQGFADEWYGIVEVESVKL